MCTKFHHCRTFYTFGNLQKAYLLLLKHFKPDFNFGSILVLLGVEFERKSFERKKLKFKTMSALTDKLTGNWNQVKGGLKQEYGQLTDDDLKYQEGQEDQLLGKIQEKTGKTKEEIEKFIDSL